MKKFGYRLSCAIIILMLILTSCTSSKDGYDKKNPVKLTLWHYYNGAPQIAFDEIVTEFNETIGRDVGIIVVAESKGDVRSLIEAVEKSSIEAPGSEELPNIFFSYPDVVYPIYKMDKIVPLEDYFNEAEMSKFIQQFLTEGQFEEKGKTYICPTAKSSEIVMANRIAMSEFFAANPNVSPANFETWEGVYEAARVYYEWTDSLTPDVLNDGQALFGVDSVSNFYLNAANQLGNNFVEKSGNETKVALDKDLFKKAWDIYHDATIRGYFKAAGSFRSDDLKTGEIISFIASTTGGKYFPTSVVKSDGTETPCELQLLSHPAFENGKKIAVSQGAGMVVTKKTQKEQSASFKFIKWFIEPERNIEFALDTLYFPVTTEAYYGEKIQEKINSTTDSSQQTQNTQAVLRETIAASDFERYAVAAFDNYNTVRRYLDDAGAFSKEERKKLLEEVESGLDYDEAIKKYTSEEVFDTWYEGLLKAFEGK